MLGIDISRPLAPAEIHALKAQGVGFVARYYATAGSPKALTHLEAEAISRAGLAIVSVFETCGTKATYFTATQGAVDGKLAAAAAEVAGQTGAAIFAAVDYDVQPADIPLIRQYLAAFAIALNPRYALGVYGPRVLDALGYPLWQAMAWSGGVVSPKAHIVQALANCAFAGVSIVDVDVAMQPLHALGWHLGL